MSGHGRALGTTVAAVILALAIAAAAAGSAPLGAPSLQARLSVVPSDASVFAGDAIRFRARAVGLAGEGVRWAVVGAGSIDRDGTYAAGRDPGGSAIVVASAGGLAAASTVSIVAPPPSDARLVLVTCYEDTAIDVRDATTLARYGTAAAGGGTAGIAADPTGRLAVFASGDRLATFDLRTARFAYSAPIAGARFSEVAMLGDRYAVATDNDAESRAPGVRVFRIGDDRVPALVASAPAGETPEGVAAAADARTFYVTAVNSNRVMRFRFEGTRIRRAGSAPTGHRPFGVALDERRRLLLLADNDTPTISGTASRPGLEVYSLPSMRRITRLDTGGPNALPLGVAIDAARARAFVTNEGEGSVAVFSLAPAVHRIATLRAGRTPWLPSIDRRRGLVYVPASLDGTFSVFDAVTLRPVKTGIATCAYPTSIAAP